MELCKMHVMNIMVGGASRGLWWRRHRRGSVERPIESTVEPGHLCRHIRATFRVHRANSARV